MQLHKHLQEKAHLQHSKGDRILKPRIIHTYLIQFGIGIVIAYILYRIVMCEKVILAYPVCI
jgi:hypothetical protein